MNSKAFWHFLQFGAIGLYALSLLLGYWLFPDSTLCAWSFFAGLVFLHTTEIPFIKDTCLEKNIPLWTIVVKTLLFGFTWWLPIKKGITES